MALGKTVVTSRLIPERVLLQNVQFCKWVARRKNVSAESLGTAINLLTHGIIDALVEGYSIRLVGIGVFECRENQPRRRYNRLTKKVYVSPAITVVHFSKSDALNTKIRNKSKARLELMLEKPSVPLSVRK